MDAGVQGAEHTGGAAATISRCNLKELEGDETPEQRIERQKNALLTMISVRELKALLGEMEGRPVNPPVKEDRQKSGPRGVPRKDRIHIGVNSIRRRNAALKAKQEQMLLPQRVTTFCFDRLEIGDFKLTAPDERSAVVPGTNWIKVDADQRLIVYQFIIARADSTTPYNVSVHVPFAHISAIFCGYPEIIIKLNQPAIQASCFQTFGASYQIMNSLDVTEGQLSRADVHKMALRRLTGNSFQEVLLAADLSLFSSILSNGNQLSASSSLYSNYVYNQPHGILSDYVCPSLQSSAYLGGMAPISMGSSLAPHLTYSAPMMNVGAGGKQLEQRRTETDKIHTMQTGSIPVSHHDEAEFRSMFENGEMMGRNGQIGEESINEMKGVKGLAPIELSRPSATQSNYGSLLMNSPFAGRPMSPSDGVSDASSSSLIPRSVSSSLYALSGSPIFPPSTSSVSSSTFNPPLSTPHFAHSYPFTPSSLMTPSPLLPLSPFFSFSSLNTPTTGTTSSFWNTTMGSLRMEEFDRIQTDFPSEGKVEEPIDPIRLSESGETPMGDTLEELAAMIPKDETNDDENNLVIDIDDEGIEGMEGILNHDEDRAKYTPSEYSFSSLCNYDAH